jgi:hypothetical protein
MIKDACLSPAYRALERGQVAVGGGGNVRGGGMVRVTPLMMVVVVG